MNPVEFASTVTGWMNKDELQWLSKTASRLRPGAVWCEIGSWMGKSWSCTALSLPIGSTIISVDTFRGEFDEPLAYVQKNGPVFADFVKTHDRVLEARPDIVSQIIVARSVPAAKLVPDGSCDVVFIDGHHSTDAVMADVLAWLPKLKENGILCGHDAYDPQVLAALKRLSIPFSYDPSERGSIWLRI